MCFCFHQIDIQEFYELVLLDESKDANTKALAVLKIAEKWNESPPLPNTSVSFIIFFFILIKRVLKSTES